MTPPVTVPPADELPEALGPDRLCAVGGHIFMFIARRMRCAICGVLEPGR